jgi:hypothetical protein
VFFGQGSVGSVFWAAFWWQRSAGSVWWAAFCRQRFVEELWQHFVAALSEPNRGLQIKPKLVGQGES